MKNPRTRIFSLSSYILLILSIYFINANFAYIITKLGLPQNFLWFWYLLVLVIPPTLFIIIQITFKTIKIRSSISFVLRHLLITAFIFPQNSFKFLISFASILELALLGFLIYGFIRVIQNYFMFRKASKSNLEAIHEIKTQFLESMLTNPLFRLAFMELQLIHYIFRGLKKKNVPDNKTLITDLNGWSVLLIGFSLVLVIETIPIHMLVRHYSFYAAWALTVLNIYSLFWIWGDYNALRLRQSFAKDKQLFIRVGLRCSTDIDFSNIESYELGEFDKNKEDKLLINTVVNGKANLLINLKECKQAVTLFGIEKDYKKIALKVTNTEDLADILNDVPVLNLKTKASSAKKYSLRLKPITI